MLSTPSVRCWLLALVATAAIGAAHAGPAADRDPGNHYILDCADGCPQKALEVPIGAPTGIATDAAGNVYFTSQHVAFKLLRDGTLIRIAGTGDAGYSGDGGPALGARLNLPLTYEEMERDPYDFVPFAGGIAVDATGNVYIADAYNGRIRRIDVTGVIHSVLDDAGECSATYTPSPPKLFISEQCTISGDHKARQSLAVELRPDRATGMHSKQIAIDARAQWLATPIAMRKWWVP
jgi:hypothetical protein